MAADVHYDLDFDNVSDYAPMKTEARRKIPPITITPGHAFHDRHSPLGGVTVARNFTHTFSSLPTPRADKASCCVHLITTRKTTKNRPLFRIRPPSIIVK